MISCRNLKRSLSSILLIAASLLLGGCATNNVSLQEVREFADASASLGAYSELSGRFATPTCASSLT